MTSGFDVCLYGKDLNLAVVGTKTRAEAKAKDDPPQLTPPRRAAVGDSMPSLLLVRRAAFSCAGVLLMLLFASERIATGSARFPQALYLFTLLASAQLIAESAPGIFGMQMLVLVYGSSYGAFICSQTAHQLCVPYMLCMLILQLWSAVQVPVQRGSVW